MKAFLYARVSTDDQNTEMQLREMRELAGRRGWQLEEFIDVMTGANARRPGLDSLMKAVRRGKCDVVLVYRFDRFARSTQHLVNALEEFRTLGVQFISLHEQIDTTTAMGKLAFTIFAAIAEFERELIRERTRSGMAQARAEGKQIGRPRVVLSIRKIKALRALGAPWREVSKQVGASVSTIRQFVRKNGLFGVENQVVQSKALIETEEEA